MQAHMGVCPSVHTCGHLSILCLCVEVSLCGLNLGVPVCLSGFICDECMHGRVLVCVRMYTRVLGPVSGGEACTLPASVH